MLKFYFDRDADSKALQQLHAAMSEDVTHIKLAHQGFFGWVREKKVVSRVYRPEADHFEYLVIYRDEFSMVQRMERGQVVPRTVHEIVCVH